MPDAVDAAVLAQQRPDGEPLGDLVAADAVSDELLPGDHPVRPGGDARDHLLDCPAFCRHWRY
jgi:hypothetical protein